MIAKRRIVPESLQVTDTMIGKEKQAILEIDSHMPQIVGLRTEQQQSILYIIVLQGQTEVRGANSCSVPAHPFSVQFVRTARSFTIFSGHRFDEFALRSELCVYKLSNVSTSMQHT